MGTTPSTPSSAELPQGGCKPSELQAVISAVIKENRDLEAREAKLGGQDPAESQGTAADNEEPIINTIVSVSRCSVASLDISETKESPLVHDFESQIETAEMGGAADGAPALVPLRMEKQLLELIDAAPDKVISLSQLPELFERTFGAPISYERFGHSKLKDLLDVIPSISVKWKQKGYECMRLVEQTNTPHHVQKHNPPTPSAGPEIKHSQGGAYGGVQKELLELIDAAPGKVILLSKLPGLFKTTFGAPISYKRFGHSKLKNLLDAIPSISVKGTQPGYEFMCRVEQTNTPHHVQKENPLTPTPSAGMEIKHSQGGADGAPALVPLRVEKELLELIDAAPGKVISLCQLPEVFKTTFGAPVYCKQFDHKMLKELLEQLSSIAIGRNPVSGKEYIYSNNRGGNMIPFAPSEDLDLRQAHLPEAPPYSATSWRDLTLVMDGAAKKLVSTSICPQIIATSNENPNGVTPSQLIVSTNGLIEAVEEEEPSDFDTGASLQLIETVEQLDRVLNLAPFARSRNYCAQEMVAIDCEGVPEKLFLVQVATGRVTYIFDCVKLGAKTVCEVLADMLKDETVTKLFHDLHKDAVAFAVIGQIHCLRGSFDTQLAMEYITGNIYMGFNRMLKQLGIEPHPTKHSMKKRMEGGTIFAKRPMASDVIDYAADDVRLLIRCKEKLATVLGDWDSWHSVQLASDKRAAMASRNGGARQICFDAANSYAVASLELLEEKCPDSMSIPTPLVVSDELDILMKLLPDDLVRDFTGMEGVLSDIVLDIGRSPHAWVGQNRVMLGGNDRIVAQTDIDGVVEKLGGFGADNRAGLERQLHRISAVRNRESEIIGLTMRVGRHVTGHAAMISDLLFQDSSRSILFLGEPGSGKTTIVRETTRLLAERSNVCIVDTSNEIAGDGNVPHHCVGLARRLMVRSLNKQAEVMIECVQNHTPEVMVVDEIGRPTEVEAAQTCKQRGVRLIASAHGDLRKLLKNPKLRGLVGGVQQVVLGDAQAKEAGGSKLRVERAGPPTFDIIVELRRGAHHEWKIILDVADAVDKVLDGQQYLVQERTRDPLTGGFELTLAKG